MARPASRRRDEATACFVAAIDSSIARGELETRSADLANLLGRTATRPADVVHMAYDLLKGRPRMATPGVIGVACPRAPDTSAI